MIAYSGSTQASWLQRFSGISYDNPAQLSLVKDKQIILGGTFSKFNLVFNGKTIGGNGRVTGNSAPGLPYFRYANRLSDRLVVGLDITDPVNLVQNWPKGSVVQNNIIYGRINSTDISPNLAYTLTSQLSAGAGLDFMYLVFDYISVRPVTNYLFTNRANSWGYSWHAGVLYKPTERTSFGLAYYNQIIQRPRGLSSLPDVTTTGWMTRYKIPNTVIFSVNQRINPKWKVLGTISRSWWRGFRSTTLVNTAIGDIPITYNFHNTWRVVLANQYILNDKWILKGGVGYDQGPGNDPNRSIITPAITSYALSIGSHFQITKSLGWDIDYSHLFWQHITINNGSTMGRYFITAANVVDTRLTLNL